MHTLFDSIHCSALGSFTRLTPIFDLIYEINTHIFNSLPNNDAWWDSRLRIISGVDNALKPVEVAIRRLVRNRSIFF
jgi:hypothetical protein